MNSGKGLRWRKGQNSNRKRSPRRLRAESLESRCLLAGDLAITELNYNPADATAAEQAGGAAIDKDNFEYIELKNVGDAALNLNGYQFTSGVAVTLGARTLQPGQIGVIVRDRNAFERRYGTGINIVGTFTSGGLSDGGERIQVVDASGAEVLDFEYDDQGLWPTRPDGGGFSLELVNVNSTPKSLYDKYYSWRASTERNGSPGVENKGQMPVIVNEVLTHTDLPVVDAIELHNTSDQPMDIGGWYLSDKGNEPFKYQIPAGTILAPNGYVVFDEGDFNPNPQNPGPNDFRLSSSAGDEVWLTIREPGEDVISDVVDKVEFGGALNGVSFGRLPDGEGILTPMSRLTLGCHNSVQRVGPLVISELNYNPGALLPAATAANPAATDEDMEFIEIHNPTGQQYSLADWRIRGDVDFDFDGGMTIAPDATLVVVSFDPSLAVDAAKLAAFRAQYSIGASVAIVGPFSGSLSNSTERVTLQFADEPPIDDPLTIPRIVADEVIYDDRGDWPTAADGNGPSLHRIAPSFYGNAAASWAPRTATPGRVGYTGSVQHDLNGDGVADAKDIDYLFDVAAYGNHPSPVVQLGSLNMDYDGSFSVNTGDVTAYLATAFHTRFGDANLDGSVDGSDFNRWYANRYTSCNKSWADGDFSGDGIVETTDFNRWSLNRFRSGPVGAAVSAAEPRQASDAAVGNAFVTVEAAHEISKSSVRTMDQAITESFASRSEGLAAEPHALRHVRGWHFASVARRAAVQPQPATSEANIVDSLAAQWGL